MIELEPRLPLRELSHGLDAGGGDGAEDERDIRRGGGGGEDLGGVGPHEPLKADGSDAEGRGVRLAKELSAEVAAGVIAEVVGAELDVANVGGVAVEIHLGEAAAFQVVKGEAGHAAASLGAEVLHGGILGMKVGSRGGSGRG